MPRIKIIRAALREIQKLSYLECEQVYEILRNLSQERDTDTILLEKYSKLRLLRTRKGKVRVIWKKDDDNDIVIIKAGYRDDVYQEDLTERDFDNQELITESELFAASQLEEIECSENPAYSWNPQKNSEWYKYFYGDYRYSPVLTSYQRNQLEGLLTKLSSSYWNRDNHGFSDKASIIQSAPGTGKTVCATLLACEIHRQQEWNIILIVPHGLRQDVAEYLEVKQVLQKNNFWLVTFRELLGRLNPEFKDKIALPEVELASFIKAANHINRNLSHISYRDVLLYQSFILDKENNNQEKNAIFKVNQKRIEDLQRINPEKWLQELKPKKSRFEIATELKNNIPELPFDNPYTLIIVDEAQDLMLCELQALIKTYEEWNKQQNLTNLWLLGDLNQRIQPTDFNWGQLKIGEPISLERNYRNSRYILEFANQFWYLAEDINNQFRAKHLPAPTNPEN
ncbi:MAG: DEAD/DEAH box helicase family protein, partial [Rivularia sp. ALOHA_DT_140]|nr:DEAD/DEAH box helicase family protein [Rivularia sp. ALOHA_DT_140]